ncbi:spermatogenesis- and oogenesis-specific basic helix-loop-helix-containing protein 1 isoform X1 [Microcaecilia unicolor]|uniref:Spermatogenesis- and oogenesis-specific basic helix-loop-helix-containing protein 1 isoform X1 n=1 Tax=Microcaecilia unicolor TaxID=1415580 RepID=A0A6P7YDF2_9AMPH|nr:spermatogenesis- and oogenesis-specific basic helix-loop-helix-containing protein 1 isoform X1 [Microcaecilia unicolor]
MEGQASSVSTLSSRCSTVPDLHGQCVDEDQRCQLKEQHQALTKPWTRFRKQNMVKERDRRRRITVSCEQLRELLPAFDGRRSDMASILEMTVKYLELVRKLLPAQQESAVLAPSKEMTQVTEGTKMDRNQISREDSRETTLDQHGMKPNTEMIGAIPLPPLPCATAEQWMDEQEQTHFKPSAHELSICGDPCSLPSADWKESAPGTKDQMLILGELDPTLLPTLEKPGNMLEVWEPSASNPDLGYHEEIETTFTDIFSFEL